MVNLGGDVNAYQGRMSGTYILEGKVNGKYYWVNSGKECAVWYSTKYKYWQIGSLKDLGTERCALTTKDSTGAEYPYDKRLSWKYAANKEWVDAPPKDITWIQGGEGHDCIIA